MVYCGKPSRGCQNCKTRRIKCDEVRPCCTQCKKSSRTCPGYPDEFDLIFRNETLAVKRRAQRAQAASAGKNNKSRSNAKKSGDQKPATPATPATPVSPITPLTPVIGESIMFYDSKRSYESPPSDSRSDSRSDSQDEESVNGSISDPLIATPVIVQNSSAFIDFSINTDDNSLLQLSPLPFSEKQAQFVDPVINSSFLWKLSYPKEPTAIGFLIQHHATRRRHEDSQRGFMELLETAYERTDSSSLLHKATYALSLGALSNSRQSVSLRMEARREYGKALRELGMVIKNPKLAVTDETLMTILVFSLYEQITCNMITKDAWLSHINGAVTLVKLRGKTQFSNPFSRKLFRAVRSSMFIASISRGEPIEDFPDTHGWSCDDEYEMNSANRLTLILLDIPAIKFRLNSLVSKEKTSSTLIKMMDCVRRAQEIDARLDDWARSLPDAWNAMIKKVVTEEPSDIWSSFFWPGAVYTYQDINIAHVLNDYRVARIYCQAVVLECVASLPANSHSDSLRQAYTRAVYVTRSMVNEICSTLPYLLGFDIENSPEGHSESMAKATKATGAYFCATPCWIMLRLSCIPELQKQWIIGRLIYIGRNHGLTVDGENKAKN